MKKIHQTKFEIFYEDTDSSGFTYHTSYLKFAERARSQFVRENLEEIKHKMINNSFFFVVKEIKVSFSKPTFLYDQLDVKTFFLKNSLASADLKQLILKNDIVICEVFVKLVWINGKSNKPSKIPKNIIARFNSFEVV
jgi:acyl-CoA thioester hydrolase